MIGSGGVSECMIDNIMYADKWNEAANHKVAHKLMNQMYEEF